MRLPYDDWKALVDKILIETTTLASDELPDAPLAQWYEEGKSPKVAARKTIAWAKTF